MVAALQTMQHGQSSAPILILGALRASGRAGSRQVKDAKISFVGPSAPIVTGTTFIFVREPYWRRADQPSLAGTT